MSLTEGKITCEGVMILSMWGLKKKKKLLLQKKFKIFLRLFGVKSNVGAKILKRGVVFLLQCASY